MPRGKYQRRPRRERDIIGELAMYKAGMSPREIAKIQNISPSTVERDIAKIYRLVPSQEVLKSLDEMRISLLKATLYRLIEAMNADEKLNKASVNNLGYAFSQVHMALRLEEGKSTANISYAEALRELKRAKLELKALTQGQDTRNGVDSANEARTVSENAL